MLFWLTSAASGPPGVSPNYSIILFTCTPSCDWRVFVSSRQQMALLAHSDSWCCFSRAGPPLGYNDPGPGLARYCEACRHCPDRPGLLSAAPGRVSASESRDNTREMRCGDTRPAHRGSLTRLQWGSGIKNKLKSRSHLLSVSQSGGNVEARGQVWLCHMWDERTKWPDRIILDLWRRRQFGQPPCTRTSNALDPRINNDAKRVTSMEFIHWIPWNNLNFPRQEGIPCL